MLELLITPVAREQDAEAAVAACAARRRFRVAGEAPRFTLFLAEPDLALLVQGGVPADLALLLTDLAHDGAIRNLAVRWLAGPVDLPPERFEIGDFLAAGREGRLTPGRWYRLHAPAGYRCRP